MDPLSITASVLAILTAAQKVSAYITTITSKSKKAPEEMLELKSTVDTTHAVLTRLQAILFGQGMMDPNRPALVLIDQVVIILSACLKIFSDLGEMMKALNSNVKIATLDRLRWATKTEEVKEYLAKMEMQKNSLNLILTILTCESSFEANRAVGRLEDLVTHVLGSYGFLAQRMQMSDNASVITANREPGESSLSPDERGETTIRVFEFQQELDSSRVYSRTRWRDSDAFSIGTRADTIMGSMMSGLSLSDVSNIGVVALPITSGELNHDLFFRGATTPIPITTTRNLSSTSKPNRREVVFMASNEYEIEDWGIRVKVSRIGILNQMILRNFDHVDIICVVPCLNGCEYPVDQVAEPLIIGLGNSSVRVNVQYHKCKNITYVLLDCPEFSAVWKGDNDEDGHGPMTDHFCSIWNQSIAKIMKRFEFDQYLVYDLRSTLALLYMLPQTVPCCYLHFDLGDQKWLRLTDVDMGQSVEETFQLHPAILQRYCGSVNRLDFVYMIATYLKCHQAGRGFISVGHESTYDTSGPTQKAILRANLPRLGHLMLPDPSDTQPFDPLEDQSLNKRQMYIDAGLERERPTNRREIQEWASLEFNEDAEIILWVGRWCFSRGVDLIASVMPAIMQKYINTQLLCIGPITDVCGEVAVENLAALGKAFPGRVFLKPEFSVLPPFIFTGAEFAIMPSRFDPWGIISLEHARKGAICIGSMLGTSVSSPGFWYDARGTTKTTVLERFVLKAIEDALRSTLQERIAMRAAGIFARFPVEVWVKKMDELRSQSIRYHDKTTIKAHH